MQIVVATSNAGNPRDVLHDLTTRIAVESASNTTPDFVTFQGEAGLITADFHAQTQSHFSAAALHGGTSCRGVIAHDWQDRTRFARCGVLAIFDPEGSYGSASSGASDTPRQCAADATLRALSSAGRPSEAPDMVFLTVAPGKEEAVLEGIRSVVGPGTPILGGSSSDNTFAGAWAQFSGDAFHTDGFVISVLFPSRPLMMTVQNGCAPTGRNGVVTAADGRRLIEIDGEPAAQVYERWTNGAIAAPQPGDGGRMIMGSTSLWPLGRVRSHLGDVPYYMLMQPAFVQPDGSLDLLANVKVGERLWQMEGKPEHLLSRPARMTRLARRSEEKPVGGLVVYCAGCMMVVEDRMHEVADSLMDAMDGAPFMCMFTFGEQGAHPNVPAEHGNLMFACAVFG